MDERKEKKTLDEMNLMDNFLFTEMLCRGEESKWFCKTIIERITNRKFSKVELISRRTAQGQDSDLHGIELDVYVEAELPDNPGVFLVFDIEPNKYNLTTKGLGRRTRFYRALTDVKLLSVGIDYDALPEAFTIFILPYDPFKKNRILYTIKNVCEEDSSIQYEDGQRTIILYTKGDFDGITYGKELSGMLRYFEESTIENAGEDLDLVKMQQMLESIRADSRMGVRTMTFKEQMKFERQEAYNLAKEEDAVIIAEKDEKLAEKDKIIAEQNALIEALKLGKK